MFGPPTPLEVWGTWTLVGMTARLQRRVKLTLPFESRCSEVQRGSRLPEHLYQVNRECQGHEQPFRNPHLVLSLVRTYLEAAVTGLHDEAQACPHAARAHSSRASWRKPKCGRPVCGVLCQRLSAWAQHGVCLGGARQRPQAAAGGLHGTHRTAC